MKTFLTICRNNLIYQSHILNYLVVTKCLEIVMADNGIMPEHLIVEID